jgi:hypothetical protein
MENDNINGSISAQVLPTKQILSVEADSEGRIIPEKIVIGSNLTSAESKLIYHELKNDDRDSKARR